MSNIQKTIPLPVILIFGPVFVALGMIVLAAAFGYIPLTESKDPIPDWWIWVGGASFLSAGLWLLLFRISDKVAAPFGLITVLLFIWTFNWIAFGPGERHFRSRTGVDGIYAAQNEVSQAEGRVVFGVFAGAMDLVIAYGAVVSLRRRK